MTTMQQPAITGYRQLSDDDARLINLVKAHAVRTGELVAMVQQHLRAQKLEDPTNLATNPHRWASLAQTELQQGFMALIRSIAQPSTF